MIYLTVWRRERERVEKREMTQCHVNVKCKCGVLVKVVVSAEGGGMHDNMSLGFYNSST